MRHATGRDDPRYAIPSALLASLAFFSYPDKTVALYALWKMLQISYNFGVERRYVPRVPYFTILLYCTSTAILFHAAILEPLALRLSYFKFLHSVTGGRYLTITNLLSLSYSCTFIFRLAGMNRECLDVFGLETTKQLTEALRRTKTTKQIAFAL